MSDGVEVITVDWLRLGIEAVKVHSLCGFLIIGDRCSDMHFLSRGVRLIVRVSRQRLATSGSICEATGCS